MRFATSLAAAFLLALAGTEAMAAPTTFGARTLEIPAPEGFVPTSAEMPDYFDYAQGSKPPALRLVEVYIDPADKAWVLADKGGMLKRYFSLEAMRETDGQPVSAADFAAAMKQMEAQIPTLSNADEEAKVVERGNANLERTGRDAKMEQFSTRQAGVFRREPWGLFFTMSATGQFTSEGSNQTATVFTAIGIVLIDGQVVTLYANASATTPDAKAWAERSVSAWADATRAANGGK